MLNFIKWVLIMTGAFSILLLILFLGINNSCSAKKQSWISSCVNWVVSFNDACQKEETFTIETNEAPTITLHNITGNITVVGHDKQECIIKIIKHGATEEALNNVEVIKDFSKNTINLKTKYLKENGKAWISYELLTPNKSICIVKNVTGSIELSNIQNSMNAQNVTGSIECSLNKLGKNTKVELETTTGSIKLTLPQNAQADVSAETTVGSVDSDFPLSFDKTEWTGSKAKGIIGNPLSSEQIALISLQATTGSIDINKQ
ncbi:hypothetical protein EBU24_02890 [bacterium]|nr:hypothetical protein [bacterium]